jgi:hypothetical protein
MPLSGVLNVFVKQKKEEFFISTSLTHLWAWKAHEYWAEASGGEMVEPHFLPHL